MKGYEQVPIAQPIEDDYPSAPPLNSNIDESNYNRSNNHTTMMNRINTNENDIYLAPAPRLAGEWNINLFDKCCSPSGFCFMSWCCNCFPLAQLYGRASNLHISDEGYDERSRNYQNAFYLFLILFIGTLIFGVNVLNIGIIIVLYKTRQYVQAFYHIPSSPLKDFFISCCCVPCSIMQIASQVWESPESIGCCQIDETPIHWASRGRTFQGERLDMELVNNNV